MIKKHNPFLKQKPPEIPRGDDPRIKENVDKIESSLDNIISHNKEKIIHLDETTVYTTYFFYDPMTGVIQSFHPEPKQDTDFDPYDHKQGIIEFRTDNNRIERMGYSGANNTCLILLNHTHISYNKRRRNTIR